MRLRSIVIGAVIALVFIALGGLAWTWRSAIAPISAGEVSTNNHQIISRGADLAAIGGCGTCHTADAGKPLAEDCLSPLRLERSFRPTSRLMPKPA